MNTLLNIATAIALTPEPLNLPVCYMITAQNELIDLTYMCERLTPKAAPKYEVTNDDLCRVASNKWFAATNQFQRDEAEKDLKVCRNPLTK